MPIRKRTLAATAAIAAVAAAAALVAAGSATAESLRIGVSSVQYDSPGAVVPAIVTVYNVPKGHQATISATGTAGSTVTCPYAPWSNPARRTISRTCYLRLPNLAGSYTIRATAQVSRGATRSTVSGSSARPVKAEGKASPTPMPMETVQAIERCHNTTNDVWLTFDDSGSATQVDSILATLRRNNVKGHFFFRGDWAVRNPALLSRIRADGHIIGNHTSTHRALSRDSKTTVLKQIDGGTEATGTPKLLRPPFGAGAFTTRLDRYAA